MATIPVTGLSSVGAALADIGENYARTKRQDELLAQHRAQQLQDVQSAHARSDANYSRARGDQLTDVAESRKREDEVYSKRRADQLTDIEGTQIYTEWAKHAEATRKLQERAPFETDMKRLSNDAAAELTQVRQRINEIGRVVMSPAPQISPNDPAVKTLAQQMAGGSRKTEEIAAMMPKAHEQLSAEAMIKHATSVRAANEMLQSYKNTEAQLTDLIQSGIQRGVAPDAPPPASPVTGSLLNPGQPLRTVGMDAVGAALQTMLGNKPAAESVAAPRGPSLIDNPTNDPIIAAGNNALGDFSRAPLQSTLNAALRERDAIAAQLMDVAKSSAGPSLQTTLATDGLFTDVSRGPITAAKDRSGLLKKQAMNDARIRELQATLQGPVPAGVTTPAVNTPTSSTPRVPFASTSMDWWMGNKPAR